MGLSDDQEGIMRRYINEGSNWQSHLNNTKEFINTCVEKEKPGNIGVLGSGWLLDVPVDRLLEYCDTIFLYDIRHPRQIVNKYKSNNKVRFIETDITGGAIEHVYYAIKNGVIVQELLHIPNKGFVPSESLDYIISVNILNQLDILIVENLRKYKEIGRKQVDLFREIIQASHIKSLPTGKSCLITDYEEQLFDRTGTFVENRSLLYSKLPEGTETKEWIWNFDSHMTYYPNRTTKFKVIAKKL